MMRCAHVWGVETHYEEHGERDAHTLVFLHGYPGRPKDFRWLVSELSSYHVIILALPGLGLTAIPEQEVFSIPSRAKFVEDFLTTIGVSSCSVIAHSMGGMVGVHLTHTIPTVVHNLILISAVGPMPYRAFRRSKPHWAYVIFHRKNIRFLGDPIMRFIFTLFGFPKGVSTESMHYVIACAAQISFPEHKSNLEHLQQPVLSIWCHDDPLIEPASFTALYACLRNAKQYSFPKGGHNPQKKHATKVAQLIKEFVSK